MFHQGHAIDRPLVGDDAHRVCSHHVRGKTDNFHRRVLDHAHGRDRKDRIPGAHPIDVLALQESAYSTSSPNPTAQAYANVLNSIYGTGTYAVAYDSTSSVA